MQLKQTNALVLNNYEGTVFNELQDSLQTCKKFYFNVAFINYGGLQLFVKLLDELNQKGVNGKVITSTYLNFSDPKALKKLNQFDNVDLKIYDKVKNKGFHSKAYIFEYEDCYKAIIGSSNITASALKSNIEWNVEIISKKDDPFMVDVMDEFTDIWDSLEEVTDEFLQQYDEFIKSIRERNKKDSIEYFEYKTEVKPNSMQKRATSNLKKLREYGEKRALVVAATGTGKTYMSAFDVKQYNPDKVLFIVHREEILNKAEESFKKVMGANLDTGFFTGKKKETESKYIFSTIQTLHRHCDLFYSDEFDYIILDEAHHGTSDTYAKVLKYFKPKFLLGMTATPERCDTGDIFDLFDNNVALEVRLHEAMEEELVVPFHYFGITDIDEIDLEGIKLDDTAAIAKALKVNQRVDYIIKQMELYEHDGEKRKCLGFCVSIDHAEFMSNEFNKRGIQSVCLTGSNNSNERELYMNRLEDENDPLEVIFTVDIFNEGIDIPSVNLVLMLRPTNSPIIFIQQLGRGLRKYDGKEYLTVLDFIGNHNRAFLIAVALKGSRYYDKDSLKVSVKNDFMNIPGDTFVQLDRISKERILKQLEFENFNSIKYLKEEYLSFKALLKGKTPKYLMDYLKYEGAPDPIKFIRYSGTYLGFLNKVEKDIKYVELTGDKEYMKYMKYLSDMLPIKRPFEFSILLELLTKKEMTFEDCKKAILRNIENVSDDSVKHTMEVLNFNYYDISQKNKWNKFVILKDDSLSITKEFEVLIKDDLKRSYILDTLYYGLGLYKNTFEETNYGIPFFKCYQTYSKQEVAMLSLFRKKWSFFRNGVHKNGNDYFLFVNLNKEKDIKESINYKDRVISRKFFQWQSQGSTTQDSEDGINIIRHKEKKLNIHLFVRKFIKVDGVVQPYIYLGKVNVTDYKGHKPITFTFKLENELPAKIYEELINKVDIKNTDA